MKYGAERGMQSWSDKLNPVELQQVSSYLLQFTYTPGKEPEGEEYIPEDVAAEETAEEVIDEQGK